LEPLPSHDPDVYQELWVCIHCKPKANFASKSTGSTKGKC
jgi:hypothetical protein